MKLDDSVAVWRLAVLTEDRTRGEHAALRRTAERLEREWNRLTSVNLRARLVPHGVLDLFVELGEERQGKHGEWWARLHRDLAGLNPRRGDASVDRGLAR